MAVTKIHPIKSTLKKALDYITNPVKTDDKLYVSSFGCAVETADIEFEKTRLRAMNKGNNLAHHLIQAFEPGEVTPETAHEIGRQLADSILGGKYEYVLTTHIDKGHVHNHLIFCSVDFAEHRWTAYADLCGGSRAAGVFAYRKRSCLGLGDFRYRVPRDRRTAPSRKGQLKILVGD